MKGPESNWRSWVGKARNDLLAIRNNVSAAETPWDVVCYHAQQAAEKMLKAFLVFHGETPRRTHDLLALLHDCTAYDKAISVLEDDCRVLNLYSAVVRYPEELAEPGEPEGRAAMDAAGRIFEAVRRRMETG
ncbi:MAG: HEPN domain-containing protein [Candidatus Brocadiia bacterium]